MIFRRKKTTHMYKHLYRKKYLEEKQKLTEQKAIRLAREHARRDVEGGGRIPGGLATVGKRAGKAAYKHFYEGPAPQRRRARPAAKRRKTKKRRKARARQPSFSFGF